MPKITKRFVDALRPGKRDVVHWDEDLARFGVRVKPSGARTYVIQYRNSGGRTRKLALGRVGVLTPDEARQRARKALGRGSRRQDPSATRNAARGAMTVAALCDDYLEAAERGLVLGKRKRPKAETTLATDRGRIERHINPLLGTMAVADVQAADVRRFMHRCSRPARPKRRSRPSPRASPELPAVGAPRRARWGCWAASSALRFGEGIRQTTQSMGSSGRPTSVAELSSRWTITARWALRWRLPSGRARTAHATNADRLLALTGCRRGEVTSLT